MGKEGFPRAVLPASPVAAPGPLCAGTGAHGQAAGEGQNSEATDLLGSEAGADRPGPRSCPPDFSASLHMYLSALLSFAGGSLLLEQVYKTPADIWGPCGGHPPPVLPLR